MTIRPAFPQLACTSLAMLAMLLQACAAPIPKPSQGAKPPPAIRQPVKSPPSDPQLAMVPGLEGVIGATASQLVRQFGAARLDVWEGDARKLQFTGAPCVLDIYLYPTSRSREPIATYVEARRSSDAVAVDRVACVKALRER